MAYSLENTADLTALGNAVRAKTGSNANMTVGEMATAIGSVINGTAQLKRIHWDRTGIKTITKNGGTMTFTTSAISTTNRYPYLFYFRTRLSGSTGQYPNYVVIIAGDANGHSYKYLYPNSNLSQNINWNIQISNSNMVITLINNNVSDILLANDTSISNEEYAQLFYFCPADD